MNIILAFVLSFCSIFMSKKVPYSNTWQYVAGMSIRKSESHKIIPHEVSIPFVWMKINTKILDSIAVKGLEYDSLLSQLSSDTLSFPPEPVTYILENMFVLYSGRKTIKSNNCSYSIITFYTNII